LNYTATAGRILLKPESDPTEAAIFFAAYTLDGEDARTRLLTLAFNGGPGTATAWLHMGNPAISHMELQLYKDRFYCRFNLLFLLLAVISNRGHFFRLARERIRPRQPGLSSSCRPEGCQ
jgi:hypothetical protein